MVVVHQVCMDMYMGPWGLSFNWPPMARVYSVSCMVLPSKLKHKVDMQSGQEVPQVPQSKPLIAI